MYCTQCNITVGEDHAYCHKCGGALVAEAPPPVAADPPVDELLSLKLRIADIEARLPRSQILSTKFWPRAFAVWGHMFAAHFSIVAVILAVVLVFAAIAGVIGHFTK
jgi:hypothetical protein